MRLAARRNLLRAAAGLSALGLALSVAAYRLGGAPMRPAVAIPLAAALSAALAGVLAVAALAAWRGPRRVASAGEALLAAGLLVAVVAGGANFLRGIQGAVLVGEREPVRLDRTDELAGLAVGPLADRRELGVTLALARLELRVAGTEGFVPVSRLRVLDDAGEERGLEITARRAATSGNLVFHQGAFGFAPRVTVLARERPVLDRFVPFRTVVAAGQGLAFEGEFEVPEEKLTFHGAVTLEDLNDDMKGHPTLELAVVRDGSEVARGTLRPGEFVLLGDGLRVGFAGLQRWSEIVFARRGYGRTVRTGALLAALGALLWVAGAWRKA